MCAICGIVNFNATESVDPAVLARMTTVQSHRGPDDEGIFLEGSTGLGHRRLSIIDLSGGKQPIFNEDESVVVVFNGEIYNYAELTSKLTAKGHHFKTRSDTETIVHAYEEYGEECLRDFRGMFAFAIWDKRRRRLFIARDRLGIKPVYYYQNGNFLAFASEIKALLEHPAVPCEMNPDALDLYLSLRYTPGPQTMLKGIYKLPPGHFMVVDEMGVRVQKYWDLQYGETPSTESELQERFELLLEESVRLRLITEVPLGVFLSGGLDSSTMVAVMSKITNRQRVKTFSVGYDTDGPSSKLAEEANEFAFAREAAAHFGADHHEYRVTAKDFANAIPTIVSHLDEPLADPSCIPLYFISKLAREHVTVILSGEGADEILGGYGLYQSVLRLDRMRRRLGPFASLASLGSMLPASKLRAYARRAGLPLERHYRGVVKGISPEVRLSLTGTERFAVAERRLQDIFDGYYGDVTKASPLNRMLYADAKVWLPEDLLLKADKITMATGVELRVPFLDHKLVEFAATLPESMKIRNKKGKWILRQAMRNVLPPRILSRPKKGFPSPTASWLRFELRDLVDDTVLARNSACRQYFQRAAVESVVHRHRSGDTDAYQDVWSLVIFEQWHQRFIRGSRRTVNDRAMAEELLFTSH